MNHYFSQQQHELGFKTMHYQFNSAEQLNLTAYL